MSFSENAANEGKVVIVSALDGTFMRKGFEPIVELIPMAEKVKKLAAICKNCGDSAAFTFRTCLSEQLELIGGDQIYKPVCRHCFMEESRMQEKLRTERKMVDEKMTESPREETSNSKMNQGSPVSSEKSIEAQE